MLKWHEVKGYDKRKAYKWQDDTVDLPKIGEEVLICQQSKRFEKEIIFVGYFKEDEFGVRSYAAGVDGGAEFYMIEDGVKWARFNKPKSKRD